MAILFVLLGGYTSYLTFRYLQVKQQLAQLAVQNEESGYLIELGENKVSATNEKRLLQYESEGIMLDPGIEIRNEGEHYLLKEIIEQHNGNMVVLRYSDVHCQTCVDDQIKILKGIKEVIGNDNIMILATYRNRKDFVIFKRMNQLAEMNIYQVDALDIPADALGTPYLFILDKNRQIRHLFIVDSESPVLSEEYYKVIIQRYFS